MSITSTLGKVLQYAGIMSYLTALVIFVKTFTKRRLFHSNLHCLLLVLPFSGLVFIVSYVFVDLLRLLGITSYDYPIYKAAMTAYHTGLYGNQYNLVLFVVERFVATMNVSGYEQSGNKKPTLALTLVATQWIISVTLIGWIEYCANKTAVLILLASIGLFLITSLLMFLLLPYISMRIYRKTMKTQFDISRRYQSVENVRSARLLNRLIIFLVVSYSALLVFYTLQEYLSSGEAKIISSSFYVGMYAFQEAVVVFVILLNHPKLKEDLFETFGMTRSNHSNLVDVNGKQLEFGKAEEKDLYFRNLQTMWKA